MGTTPMHDYPSYTKQPFISKQHGFTIVELLIVIVVIAILAAISVVTYNGVQERATQTANFAAIRNYTQAFQLMKAETGGLPTGSNSDSSCLGPMCSMVLGTSAATISGQTPSEASTNATKNLLAEYGLTTQPDVKGEPVTHLVYSENFYGEPALLWYVRPNRDCVSSPSRMRAGASWVDNIKRGDSYTTYTRCSLSLRDI